jgi:hypothetical protein
LAVTSTTVLVFAASVAWSAAAVGGSLTSLTVTATVAVLLLARPSLAL